ncbi:MAG: ABC transporter ATP-binding protein [Deltaproteobacteria bacterium]|uniref:ABC transporter ATP-binding protein n=1 Tax=Desulfobacula sp. TaxID=2593537 RepID=UPI0019BA5459|nr:ABC transporter ATP-binding protein [Candidatus Desulfobacula maris]MBL6994952.1 ABC transporter ATP-binding protein [Desulfobacula sp.]
MKLIYPYFKKNFYKILLGILCMIIVDAMQLVIPQIVKNAIDTLSSASFDKKTLILQCALIIFLGLFMAVFRYGWRNLLMISARDVEKGIRDDLFKHVLSLDMAYLDKVKTGDIMAHATSDINHIRMAFGFGLIVLVDTILLGGATLAIMVWTHPKLTAIAMIPMPFLIFATRTLGKKMHAFHKTAQESFSQLTELVRESFFGIRIIKVFNFEGIISNKVENASTDYFKKNLKRAFVTALIKPLLIFFLNLSTLVVIFYGGFLVMKQVITPGELVAFFQYLGILAWPVIALGWMTNLFQRGMASLQRINTLLDSMPEVSSPENPNILPKVAGNIIFEDVSFGYDKDKAILSNINLKISQGNSIGISGPPGSGKSSLIQLIPRLYNVSGGKISIDGIDVNTLDLNSLRQNIALMPQEAFLFSGTIKENILMGKNVDKEKLDQIIRVCCLKDTIEKMPEGLDTIVGERGINLSGGQKQRIALARTLMSKKPIIILDDPISQMDTNTASKIISQLNRMNFNSTFIIISHRISALASCDTIFILKSGRINHFGTHEKLIQTDRFYRKSYQVQQFEEGYEV